MRPSRGISAVIAVLLALGALLVHAGSASAATVICAQYGSTTIQNRYVVMNNEWGDSTPQCITVSSSGFSVTTASHNLSQNGAPAAYPAVYYGCHYGNCSPGTSLPARASSVSGLYTSVSMSYPGSGVYDASYDIWYDPTPRTNGQNTGAEIMVWLNHTGSVQPFGSRVGTANLAGASWTVWEGRMNGTWNVISYVRNSTTNSIGFNPSTFYNDAVSRGYANNAWYLTSVQAGFEPWVGGTGLTVNSFSAG